MADDNLEQTPTQEEPTKEQVEETSTEPEGEVSTEVEDVSKGEGAYNKLKVDELLLNREREWQSKADQQIHQQTAKYQKQVKDLRKQIREQEWAVEDRMVAERYSEYPDVSEFLKTLRQQKIDFEEEREQFEEMQTKVTHDARRNYAYELIADYPDELTIEDVEHIVGSGEKQLEMKAFALDLVNKRVKAKATSKPKPAQKIDSGKIAGSGQKTYKYEDLDKLLNPAKMTPKDISAQLAEFEKAIEEGRVK